MALSEGLKSFVGFFTKGFNDGSDEDAFTFENGIEDYNNDIDDDYDYNSNKDNDNFELSI